MCPTVRGLFSIVFSFYVGECVHKNLFTFASMYEIPFVYIPKPFLDLKESGTKVYFYK